VLKNESEEVLHGLTSFMLWNCSCCLAAKELRFPFPLPLVESKRVLDFGIVVEERISGELDSLSLILLVVGNCGWEVILG
jgi:hypothetical protein